MSTDRISSVETVAYVLLFSVSPSVPLISIFPFILVPLLSLSLSLYLSIFLSRHSLHSSAPVLACFVPRVLGVYTCLYRFRQLQRLREIMEKPCGETKITNVLPACGAEIDGVSRRQR